MTPSDDLLEFLRWWEGLPGGKAALIAYDDGGGVFTIGYGHTRGVTRWMRCSADEAEDWLEQDAEDCGEAVRNVVEFPMTQNELDALTAFVFNVGPNALYAPAMSRALKDGPEAVAQQLPRWVHDGGKVVPGLVKRRNAELAMFTRNDYSLRP